MPPKANASRNGKRKRKGNDAALPPDAQEAIPGISLDVVVTHVLRSEFLPHPRDLARLRAVSRSMRDAVAKTGRRIKKPDVKDLARLGDLSALVSLRERGALDPQKLSYDAAEHGQLKVLKLAWCGGCKLTAHTCKRAAKGGHLEVLKWLRRNNCPWNTGSCASAAEEGHLVVLKWLRANGCPWNAGSCERAALKGQLEVLKWLRAKGCLWNGYTCARAAQHGHLEVLKWAHENGCPWGGLTRHSAELKWPELFARR